MYPMSAQLGHPENEELMPLWGQVVMNGLTRAPDVVDGHNANTKSHATTPGFGEIEHPEIEHPEIEHPEHGMGFVFSSEGVTTNVLPASGTSSSSSTPTSGFNFGAGFGGEAAEEGEHCPFVPIDQCVFPCMKFGNTCTGEMRLKKALALYPSSEKSQGLTSMEILYCLWGLTTGLLCGVCYMVWM